MIPVETILVLPFLIVGVIWVLIDDEEFDRQYKEWVEKNEDKNV